MTPLDFEKPITELEDKAEELRLLAGREGGVDTGDEVQRLQGKADRLLKQIYARLTPAQKVQVARHAARPHVTDYVRHLMAEFTPLAGDRLFGEDRAMIGGLARFRGRSVLVLGQEKGHDTETRVRHNFGMASPEGYRKAQRLMDLANRWRLPVVTLVDTSGAYPGVAAEERGQAEAIARSIRACLALEVPLVAAIIGEGGSGGAVAIATADHVLMLEHAIYSVISPEGCASILWRSAAQAQEAASALRLTAQDLKEFGVIDEIVPEPHGGAHRKPNEAMDKVGDALQAALTRLSAEPGPALRARRRDKFLAIGGHLLS